MRKLTLALCAATMAMPVIPAALSVRTLDQLTQFVATVTDQPPTILGFFSLVDRQLLQDFFEQRDLESGIGEGLLDLLLGFGLFVFELHAATSQT